MPATSPPNHPPSCIPVYISGADLRLNAFVFPPWFLWLIVIQAYETARVAAVSAPSYNPNLSDRLHQHVAELEAIAREQLGVFRTTAQPVRLAAQHDRFYIRGVEASLTAQLQIVWQLLVAHLGQPVSAVDIAAALAKDPWDEDEASAELADLRKRLIQRVGHGVDPDDDVAQARVKRARAELATLLVNRRGLALLLSPNQIVSQTPVGTKVGPRRCGACGA